MASPSWGQNRRRLLAAGAIAAGLMGLGAAACSGDPAQPEATAAPGSPAAATATPPNEATTAPASSPTGTVVDTRTPTGSGGGGPETTLLPNPPPLPSPAPIPQSWVTFQQQATQATAAFTLRVPPTWTLPPTYPRPSVPPLDNHGWTFTSWVPAAQAAKGQTLPDAGIKLDIGSEKIGLAHSSCAIKTSSVTRIGNVDAQYGVLKPVAPSSTNLDTVYNFKFTVSGFEYCISGLFTKSADRAALEQTFSQVINSLRFLP